MQNGSVGYAYWPEQLTVSSDTFHTAMISNSTSTTVDGEGGSVDLEDGDQSTGNSGVDLFDDIDLPLFFDLRDLISPAPNSSTNVTITLTQLYDELNDSPSLWGKVVNGISVEVNPENSQKGMRVRISIANKTVMNKFVMVYRKNNSIPWAEGRVLKIEKVEDGVVFSAIVPQISGQFAVFESTDLDDSDYRPQKRVKIKSRIASEVYTGFEFKGLKEGDVVKIYSVSGKKIAEVTDVSTLGVACWRGRKGTNNSGDWAESGTYIYQIKLKEKNKIVSGTIAFVW